MADIETGKIENDKEKKIIDEMTDGRSKPEDTTFPAINPEEKKEDYDSEVIKEWADTNLSGVLSKSEGNKDSKESGSEIVETQADSEIEQLHTTGKSSTEIEVKDGQPHDEGKGDKCVKSDETISKLSENIEESSAEITDNIKSSTTETTHKAERHFKETTEKMEEHKTEMRTESEGPSTEGKNKSNTDSTEITQTELSDETIQKPNEYKDIVRINESIPQSEVTTVGQTEVTKEEILPDQSLCSEEILTTKSEEEKEENESDKLNSSEMEIMDQSESEQHTPEAAVLMECENETSKQSESNSIQSQSDISKETVDVGDPRIDNENNDSNLEPKTLKISPSESSLDSKKDNFDDTSYANEMDHKSALISSDTIQLPMELDNESIQSETAMFDTPGPATPASSIVDVGPVSAGPTPSKRSRQNSTGSGANVEAAAEDLENHTFPASKVFEYQWPKDSSGEYYMLQEQISEFLGVKSFKRKYPELQRRPVEMNERMFLREKGAVTETQCDLGLTAIRSDEVYDLMHRDYPDKYAEYAAVLHERERQTIKEKHKDYEVPKLEKSKMTEYIRKAMKSASEWNTSFLRERKEERRAYFDLQTFNVHYPAGRFKVLPTEYTSPSPYPVTLIPGQYQDYYKNHSPEELKYLPLNTALYNPPKQLGNNLANPQEVLSEEASEEDAEGGGGSDSDSDDDSSSGESDDSSEQDSGQIVSNVIIKNGKEEDDLLCRMCEKQGEAGEDMVQCSECKKFGHPTCLDLTTEMVTVIKTYPWQCMECKTCVECMDPYDEDKMIFCDRCDRGYHTFCVGLRSIPNGQWKCRSCKSPDTPRTPKSSSKLRGRGRKRGNNTPAKDG